MIVVRDSSLSQPKTTLLFEAFPSFLQRTLIPYAPGHSALGGVGRHHLPLASPFTERDVELVGVGSLAHGPCLGSLCHFLVTLAAASL